MRRGRSSEGLACTTLAKACFNFFKNGPLLRNRHGIREQLHAGATRAPAGQAAEHMDSLWRHPNAYFGDVCSVLAYSHRRTGSDEHAAVLSSICNNQRRVTACSEMQQRSGFLNTVTVTCALSMHPFKNALRTAHAVNRCGRVALCLRPIATTHRRIARHDTSKWLWSRTVGLQRFPTEEPAAKSHALH